MEIYSVANIEIYTSYFCGYCARAKSLLKAKSAEFTEISLDEQPNRRTEMVERAGGRQSVPQIFIDGRYIGGSDDLAALDQAGKLDQLLAA